MHHISGFPCCRQLHLFSNEHLIDEAMPAYVQAQNPTALEFLSRCAPPMLPQWQKVSFGAVCMAGGKAERHS